jgi:hypothetical protein
MPQVTGVVEARNERALCVAGGWYGAYKGQGIEKVVKGDTVDLEWSPDKTGKYKNIKSCKVLSGAVAGAAEPARRGYSNVGVEIGHAMNLAMEVARELHPVGSLEFYKALVEHTGKMHKISSRLRAAAEAGKDIEELVKHEEPELPEPAMPSAESMKSIF